jgi:putative hydrolase of the HAD superfamily
VADGALSPDAAADAAPRPFDAGGIRAVAFDAYGTLFHYEEADAHRVAMIVLEQMGLTADRETFTKAVIEAWSRASAWAEHRGSDGKVDRALLMSGPVPDWVPTWEIWRRQFGFALADHGLTGDPEAYADYMRDTLGHAPAFDDAYETVERLAAHGLLVGLMSNADEDFLQRAVSRARLRFSVIQSSESMRVYKPNRAAFLALAGRFGVEPHEVLYVGDTPGADVAGALNAGLRACYVRRHERPYPEDTPAPDLTVATLAAIGDALGAQ